MAALQESIPAGWRYKLVHPVRQSSRWPPAAEANSEI
jgi:hypothetical protein